MKTFKDVDAYIAAQPKQVGAALAKLRHTIKKAAPRAHERISYGMPFYEYGGSGYAGRLIYFAAFKKHISVFIPPSLGGYPKALRAYQASKSSFHFPLDASLPFALLEKTVRAIVKERDASKKAR